MRGDPDLRGHTGRHGSIRGSTAPRAQRGGGGGGGGSAARAAKVKGAAGGVGPLMRRERIRRIEKER